MQFSFHVAKDRNNNFRVVALMRDFDYPIETFEHFALFQSKADAEALMARIQRGVWGDKRHLDTNCWLNTYQDNYRTAKLETIGRPAPRKQ